MRSRIARTLFCVTAALTAAAQHHGMPKKTLFTARARAADVASDASATGAFILSADAKSVRYRITWDRLRSEKIALIDLHNFAEGKAGPSVHTLCGRAAAACPQTAGGTIEGTWSIPGPLTRELGVQRIYVDIHTSAADSGEIRGQVLPLPWMVHSEQFIARMRNGTATLYITPFPRGTEVQFDVTVAGLKGRPAVEVHRAGARVATLRIDDTNVKTRGSTVSGVVKDPTAALLAAIRSGNATLAVVSRGTVVRSGKLEPVM